MANQSIELPKLKRWICGIGISSLGVITGLMHIDHLLEDVHTMPIVSGIVFPLCLSVALLCAGYWLGTSGFRGERAVRIAILSLGGAISLTLAGTVVVATDILLHQHALPATDGSTPAIILPSSVTEGTVVGLLYGIYETRSNRQPSDSD